MSKKSEVEILLKFEIWWRGDGHKGVVASSLAELRIKRCRIRTDIILSGKAKTGQSGVTAEVALYGYTAIEDVQIRLTIPSRLVFINLSVSSQYLRAEWSRTGRNGAKYLPSLMG